MTLQLATPVPALQEAAGEGGAGAGGTLQPRPGRAGEGRSASGRRQTGRAERRAGAGRRRHYLVWARSRRDLSSALSMVFSLSPRHRGQYHLPLGLWPSPTQEKWNHSMGHWSLSQPIISP